MSIGQPRGMLLNEFGERVRAAFGEVAYHVGSSLAAIHDKKVVWRDVDVRCMLDDEEWEKMGLGDPANPHGNAKWRALCIVFSNYGQHVTGLPIDFQLQQRTHANAHYSTHDGCRRSALMVVNHELPEEPMKTHDWRNTKIEDANHKTELARGESPRVPAKATSGIDANTAAVVLKDPTWKK